MSGDQNEFSVPESILVLPAGFELINITRISDPLPRFTLEVSRSAWTSVKLLEEIQSCARRCLEHRSSAEFRSMEFQVFALQALTQLLSSELLLARATLRSKDSGTREQELVDPTTLSSATPCVSRSAPSPNPGAAE